TRRGPRSIPLSARPMRVRCLLRARVALDSAARSLRNPQPSDPLAAGRRRQMSRYHLNGMHGRITSCAVVAFLVLGLAACQSVTGETAGENIDDTTITTAVKAKLAGEKATTLTKIGVETNLRVVHLTGVVTSDELRQRAVELARSVKGVRAVKNDIEVRPAS